MLNFLKSRKKFILFLTSITALMLLFIFCVNIYIIGSSSKFIIKDIDNIPKSHVVLVLGAKVSGDRISPMFQDRLDTAISVHNSKKADKILVSGDHGKLDYDEVNTAKKYLLDKNIKEEDIFLDYAGFDTYDSVYRAKEIYGVKSVIITTQNFHLPRAVYIAKNLGLEVYGFSSDLHQYGKSEIYEFREMLSRIKAWIDATFKSKPRYSGDPIPIEGDGRKSWD